MALGLGVGSVIAAGVIETTCNPGGGTTVTGIGTAPAVSTVAVIWVALNEFSRLSGPLSTMVTVAGGNGHDLMPPERPPGTNACPSPGRS